MKTSGYAALTCEKARHAGKSGEFPATGIRSCGCGRAAVAKSPLTRPAPAEKRWQRSTPSLRSGQALSRRRGLRNATKSSEFFTGSQALRKSGGKTRTELNRTVVTQTLRALRSSEWVVRQVPADSFVPTSGGDLRAGLFSHWFAAGCVFFLEPLNPSARIDEFLPTREKGVAIRADLHVQNIALVCGTCFKRMAAGANNRHFVIVRVNAFLHGLRFGSISVVFAVCWNRQPDEQDRLDRSATLILWAAQTACK
jgi:hypothetical protein